MRKWAKEHGLMLANIGLFVLFFGGMVVSGAADYSEDQLSHGQPAVSIIEYLERHKAQQNGKAQRAGYSQSTESDTRHSSHRHQSQYD